MEQDGRRRLFLKYIGAGTAVVGSALSGVRANQEVESVGEKPHYGMVFDQNKCVGCTECEVMCKKVNSVPQGQARLYVQNKTNPETPMEKRYTRVSCQQCEDAPCVSVCPTKACHKDEQTGIVTMNPEDCIACKYCIVACPYDVRFINHETKAAENCNFCLGTKLAKNEEPACVQACKYKALVFGDLNDKDSYINQILGVKDSVRMKPFFGTKPSLRYIPVVKVGV
ncbi:4Fe-4S dicluster domain-containing protein [Wolinella succinogenes]|uniref:PUTATIVE NITRITE REDUCTASE, FORMATE-DEPENDENT, FE-S CENTERS n=1 Tax=Wolinella succinogenes (strain ATCC 29543 / DSM 1740 / CCUG 13145 / JCM 31913 / LMG 7466 / NCTC 11488 / FDC 602W) TaxID=273121 RepID=Q7MA99_WOLSU|nr:4Fe-4S dicluster domain-containing protein [Wolinella succinogenes]NLU33927.1 4Fe-4S dicluster domain-containing protein [Wolinella succinogenes]CAE09528.1 PUTATIVE NITRITE REDUCTASE, FORMATE-DEPENDENT, FE-S CENTERS [Wolinella succinogenes]VEG81741.1 DMSO reductase iron-sulfur subunit [Wolinella succinogenes]HCZ18354.1 4Fe-4S dicluster domain-containing protein [Helicobacter sp.]